jgi:hypothetical protein
MTTKATDPANKPQSGQIRPDYASSAKPVKYNYPSPDAPDASPVEGVEDTLDKIVKKPLNGVEYPFNLYGLLETLRGNNPNTYPTTLEVAKEIDSAIQSLLEQEIQNIIGEDEGDIFEDMRPTYRNELRAEQRAKLKQLEERP